MASSKEAKPSSDEPEGRPPFGNFWRILSYGSRLDFALMAVAALCAAGTGVVCHRAPALSRADMMVNDLVGD
ncbi:hypothetical protein DIZ76_012421 [Coccidioides immitis]|nr:hypothetical protein DIZ76_012421 [Coccidioides immitis]